MLSISYDEMLIDLVAPVFFPTESSLMSHLTHLLPQEASDLFFYNLQYTVRIYKFTKVQYKYQIQK